MSTPDNIKTYRDPILSLWQSAARHASSKRVSRAATDRISAHAAVAEAPSPVSEDDLMTPALVLGDSLSSAEPVPVAPTASPQAATAQVAGPTGIVGDCAAAAAKFLWAEIKGDQAESDTYAAILKSSECDVLGWAECLETYLAFKASMNSLPYRPNQQPIVSIPDQATIAIIGDWGTGGSNATNLLRQVATFKPDILLHLGDVYFAGTQDEANSNFLEICRDILGDIPLYSLCGNHDMYSGGDGYYWLLDQIGQKASYFCLQNDHWQLLAMDTGYNDRNPLTINTNMTSLYSKDGWNEADWHHAQIANGGGRKLALFSHHQLFSPFSSVGTDGAGKQSAYNPNLLGTFQDVLQKVDIWFWGHEHTLALYDPYLGLSRGRCVGASAIPVFTNQQAYVADNALLNDQLKSLPTWNPVANLGNTDGCYNNAFAIMTLNGAEAATVKYFQVPLGGAYVDTGFVDTI